ncbi:MAG: PAS domain S-box protein [Verrucomicrobiota bacterium]|nr:PAS domain S-box protein [Verrucomicrobiota bacterium]
MKRIDTTSDVQEKPPVILFIVVIVVILVCGVVYYQKIKQDYLQNADLMLNAVADLKVGELTRWREERLNDTRSFIDNKLFSQLVASVLQNSNNAQSKNELGIWLKSLIEHSQYDRVILLDLEGHVRYKSRQDEVHDSALTQDLIKEVIRTGRTTWVDFYYNEAEKKNYLGLLVPISSVEKEGALLGVLAVRIDPQNYLYPFITRWPTASDSGETLLVRKEGHEVLYLNPLRFRPDASLNLRISLDQTNVPAVQVVKGALGNINGPDYRGVEVMASVRAIPNSPWYLVARMDRAEILQPLVEQLRILVVLVGSLIVMAALGMFSMHRQNKLSYYKKELTLMEALRESEESLYITLHSIGDAVIATDMEGCITRMNKAAEELTEWPLYEALRSPLNKVFVIVNADTRKPVTDPVKLVLDSGKTVGLANHTVLISKNGKEYQIADSAAPIRDNSGNIRGVILVFSDVTEKYAAAASLLESESRLRRAIINAPFPMMIHAEDGEVMMLSDAWTEITGYTHADIPTTEAWAKRAYGERVQLVKEDIRRLYELQARQSEGEYTVRTKTGEERVWDFSSSPLGTLKDGRRMVISMAMDVTSRKQAEVAMRRSQADYQLLFNSMLDGYALHQMIYDAAGKPVDYRFLAINPAFEHLTGLRADAVVGRTVLELMPLTESIWIERYGHVAKTGEPVHFENYNAFLGKYYEVQAFRPAPDQFAVVFADTTARKRTEIELRRERQFLDTVLNAQGALVIILDTKGKILRFNPACEALSGYKLAEIQDRPFWDTLLLPEEREQLIALFDTLVAGHFPNQRENFWLCKNGSKRMIAWTNTCLVEDDGRVTCVISCGIDITDRIETEIELAINERNYREIFHATNDAIFIHDAETGRIVDVNDTMLHMYGYESKEAIIGMSMGDVRELEPPYTIQEAVEFLKLAAEGQPQVFEWHALKADNTAFWVEVSLKATVIGGQKRVLAVVRDISERKQAEDAILKAKERAEESDRLKSAFLANMSHEIRTPMNGIIGFTELLKEPNLEEKDRRDFIRIIEESSGRLLNIINDLIDISKIEAGQMELHLANTSINELMNSLHAFFEPEAKRKNLALNWVPELPDNRSIISTDPVKLSQILTNLIKNALKFTFQGEIRFGYVLEDGNLLFFVQDTGIGIAPDLIDKVFERFRQGSLALSRPYEGAGLGLSIAKAYVEMMGGKIWIESEEHKGTSLYFTLSYTPVINSPPVTPPAPIAPLITPSSKTVLIAEDEPNNMNLLVAILRKAKLNLLKASNGAEAVGLFSVHSEIDIVLMDVKMPIMDGLEATRKIKSIRPNVPVIALTAYAMKTDEFAAREAGCDDYLSKPVRLTTLMERINSFLDKA